MTTLIPKIDLKNGGSTPAGAINRTINEKAQDLTSVKDFGAVGDGTVDDTAAIQAAITSGKALFFPAGTYKTTSTITYTGTVYLVGKNATIQSNCLTFKFTNASNSRIKGLNFLPATVPYTIRRNVNTWVSVPADVIQSYEGYMPTTPADDDIWSGLSPTIQAQTTTDTFDWPAIWFFSSSATANTNVEVSEVTGFTLTIAFDGYVNSTVRDCNFGSGASIGGVVFNNNVAQDYQYGGLGYTLAQGVNNSAMNNIVRYATYSNIWFCGNTCFAINGNQTSWCGETGIKLTQTDGTATNPVGVVNTFGVIDGNLSFNNANDGIDAAATYGLAASFKYDVNTVVSNNQCLNNKYTGIASPGVKYLTITGNSMSFNGQMGLNLNGSDCAVTGNLFNQNSYHPELFVGVSIYDCLLTGDNICSTGNYIYDPAAPNTYNYIHQGAIGGAVPTAGAEGVDSANTCSGGISRFFVSPTIPTNQQDITSGTGKFTTATSVTLTALNTYVTVMSPEAGMILLRDDTLGGNALFLSDVLTSIVTVSNGITGLTAQTSGGNFQIQVTSGAVPRTISWAAFLTS
jgi:hypothetical protein